MFGHAHSNLDFTIAIYNSTLHEHGFMWCGDGPGLVILTSLLSYPQILCIVKTWWKILIFTFFPLKIDKALSLGNQVRIFSKFVIFSQINTNIFQILHFYQFHKQMEMILIPILKNIKYNHLPLLIETELGFCMSGVFHENPK